MHFSTGAAAEIPVTDFCPYRRSKSFCVLDLNVDACNQHLCSNCAHRCETCRFGQCDNLQLTSPAQSDACYDASNTGLLQQAPRGVTELSCACVKKKIKKIGHHARPRRASATAPLRTGADIHTDAISDEIILTCGTACVGTRHQPRKCCCSCPQSSPGCPRCRFPTRQSTLGHCRNRGRLHNCRRRSSVRGKGKGKGKGKGSTSLAVPR